MTGGAVSSSIGPDRLRRWEWGHINEKKPAYAWSRFLTPLYGVKVIGLLAGMTYAVSCPVVDRPCVHVSQNSTLPRT